MRRLLLLSITCTIFLLASCGSGGSVGADTQVEPNVLSGIYSGAYTTNAETVPIPFTLVIAQTESKYIGLLRQMETTYSGTFNSAQINGQMSGRGYDFDLSLTVTEPSDGGQITILGTINGMAINITSITGTTSFGTYTSGSGSCTRNMQVSQTQVP
jgi:hypothetical protein